MTLNSRRPSLRTSLPRACLLLALLAGGAGLPGSIRRTAAVFATPNNPSARNVFTLVGLATVARHSVLNSPDTNLATHSRLRESYGQLPLSFEANEGQTDSNVKFLARGNGYGLFLTATEAVLVLRKQEGERRKDARATNSSFRTLQMKLAGANPTPRITGLDELPGKANYFIGKDPGKWRPNVSTYARVKREAVYPGVDMVYYGNQRQLEYDFIVAPGADAGRIKLSFEGARDVRIDARGDLVLRLGVDEVRQQRPVVYQEAAGVRQEIVGHYVMKGRKQVGFDVGRYDSSRPLVIDPVLVYSTYLGGSGEDAGFGIAVDSAGNAYVTGNTASTDFPATPGAFNTTYNGGNDAFVAKFNATGSYLLNLFGR